MDKHPITIEKDHLKSIAADIVDLKERIRGPKIVFMDGGIFPICRRNSRDIGSLQQRLAQIKRVYRHRFAAYCLVRQSLGKTRGPIMAPGTKLNLRIVNIHRVRLLSEIARAQSKHIDSLGEDLANYEPCIATFKSKATGAMKNLKIQDFQIKDNGDFIWNCKEEGTVFNQLMNWEVERNDSVNLEKEDYDGMAPILKLKKDQINPFFDKEYHESDSKFESFQAFQGKMESYWNFVKPKNSEKLPFLYQKECYQMVYDVLNRITKTILGATLIQCWTSLPTVPNQVIKKTSFVHHGKPDHKTYEVCGHNFSGTVTAEYVRDWAKDHIITDPADEENFRLSP